MIHEEREVRIAAIHDPPPIPASELILRRLLWLRHGCPFAALYGDDGEMSCDACRLDFRRMPAAEIEMAFYRQGARKLAQASGTNAAQPNGGTP